MKAKEEKKAPSVAEKEWHFPREGVTIKAATMEEAQKKLESKSSKVKE